MDVSPHRYSNLHGFGRNWYYTSVRTYCCLKAKVNGVNMVKMSKLILSSLFLSLLINAPGHAATLFYGGDRDESTGDLGAQNQIGRGVARAFDDFAVTSPTGWQIDSVFSNNIVRLPFFDPQNNPLGINPAFRPFYPPNFDFTPPLTVEWSIRSGISADSFGTLIAGGNAQADVTETGRILGDVREYTFSVSGLNVSLDPGNYFLSVTPNFNIGTKGYDIVESTTLGQNAIDNLGGNNSSFVFFGDPGSSVNFIASNPSDLSFGLTGDIRGIQGETTAVPEPLPAPWLVGMLPLGFGLLKGKLSALRSRAKSKVN
jgi:hypothetical protein